MRGLALALLALLSPPALAADQPQAALGQTMTAPLPVAGKLMGVARDGLVIAADDANGGGLVLLLDPVTLDVRAQAVLDAPVLALAAREDRDGLAVLAGDIGAVSLHRFGAGLVPIGVVPVGALDRPGLSLTVDGRSVVAAQGGDLTFTVFDEAGQPMALRKTYEATRPLAGAWIANDVAYFNAAGDLRLSAATLESGVSYSEYQVSFKDGRMRQPFSVAPLLADRQCRGEYNTEFLLAHADPGLVTLLRADPDRSILRPVAETAIDTREPYGSSGPVRIASSCNGAAVWLAGVDSGTLSQFSVVRDGDRLEQVGMAPLPGPSAALALNWDGKSGWVLLRDQPAVIRFELAKGEPPPLPGSDTVRELQRLLSERGYSVGAVDGIMGDRTRRAAALIGRSLGTRLDLRSEQGLRSAIAAIKELPASRY